MQQVSVTLMTPSAPDTPVEPAIGAAALRPALFARYGALARLRFDFPLVLVEGTGGGPVLRPLTGIVDAILRQTAAPDATGEELRQQVLRLEGAIRERVVMGARDTLTNLWRHCAEHLVGDSGEPPFGPLDTNLDCAREALTVDGPVIDCDGATPKAVLAHAWKAVHEAKALLNEARIAIGHEFKVEFSHHYGVSRFRETGAILIECINREYCKKLVLQLPGQRHPPDIGPSVFTENTRRQRVKLCDRIECRLR